jgi:hypothetical protein
MPLIEKLPEGSYPCIVFLGKQALSIPSSTPLHLVSTPGEAPRTRSEEPFNSSHTAEAPPLLQPQEEITLMLNVSYPLVRLSAPSVPVSAMWHSDSAAGEAARLFLELSGRRNSDPMSVLVSVGCAAGEKLEEEEEVAWEDEGGEEDEIVDVVEGNWREDDVAGDPPALLLPVPASDCLQRRIRLQWRNGSLHARQRLLFGTEDDAGSTDAGMRYILQLGDAKGVRVIASDQVTLVGLQGAIEPQPMFSVNSQKVVHRGEDLIFSITRDGAPSAMPSHLKWDIVFLRVSKDVAPAAFFQDRQFAGARPPVNISAALGGRCSGSVTWNSWSVSPEMAVQVHIHWGEVPYDARWMLAIQLSALSNGRLRNAVFAPAAEAGSSLAPGRRLQNVGMDATAFAVEPPQGGVTNLASQVHVIVYGTPQGACPPGRARISGMPQVVPLMENATATAAANNGLLGFFATWTPEEEGSTTPIRLLPPSPPYRGMSNAYDIMLPHDATAVDILLVSPFERALAIIGNVPLNTTAEELSWSTQSDLPGLETGTYTARWPVEVGKGAQRSATVLSCPTADPCSSTDHNFETFTITIFRQFDPALARLASIAVSVADDSMPICGAPLDTADAPPADSDCSTDSTSGMDNGTLLCPPTTCDPGNVLRAVLNYHRGDTIRVSVAPQQFPGVGLAITIGQRVFAFPAVDSPQHAPSMERKAVVSFTLFNKIDKLSPFVPFFIRTRSQQLVTLEVPVTLTLSDRLTSIQQSLMLTIHITPPRERVRSSSPQPALAPSVLSTLHQNSSIRVSPPPLETALDYMHKPLAPPPETPSPSKSHVVLEVVSTTGTSSSGQSPAGLSATEPPSSQRLLAAISSSAPENQPWIEDPQENKDCEECPAGSFSFTCAPNP